MSTIRITYVGPLMDLIMAAGETWHRRFGHAVDHRAKVEDLLHQYPAPDVVVCRPLAKSDQGLVGACALQSVIGPGTLLVALVADVDGSHAQWAHHSLVGACHPRMLIHYATPAVDPEELVGAIDRAARRNNSRVETTRPLPKNLLLPPEVEDLGQIMADDDRFARLLYAVAVHGRWETDEAIASTLHITRGSLKNLKTQLRNRLYESGCLPAEVSWSSVHLVRCVAEHLDFIEAFVPHHCETVLAPEPMAAA